MAARSWISRTGAGSTSCPSARSPSARPARSPRSPSAMAASTFQLPAHARVKIRTASARLEPTPDHAAAGELFVGGDGTMGVKMSQGNVRVEELTGARRTMTASLEPVFLPKRPATSGPLFAVDAPAESPAAGAKAVFSPKGENLGFLQPDKQLVVRPGYTADLTQSFPPKTVQLAMAKIPSADSGIAMPVFDVNGGYVGYLAGPTFHAQAIGTQSPPAGQVQMAQAVGAGGAAGGSQPVVHRGRRAPARGPRHWWALLRRGVAVRGGCWRRGRGCGRGGRCQHGPPAEAIDDRRPGRLLIRCVGPVSSRSPRRLGGGASAAAGRLQRVSASLAQPPPAAHRCRPGQCSWRPARCSAADGTPGAVRDAGSASPIPGQPAPSPPVRRRRYRRRQGWTQYGRINSLLSQLPPPAAGRRAASRPR